MRAWTLQLCGNDNLVRDVDQTLNKSLSVSVDNVDTEFEDTTDNLPYFLVQPKARHKGELKAGEVILIYLLEDGRKKATLASKNLRYFKNASF